MCVCMCVCVCVCARASRRARGFDLGSLIPDGVFSTAGPFRADYFLNILYISGETISSFKHENNINKQRVVFGRSNDFRVILTEYYNINATNYSL